MLFENAEFQWNSYCALHLKLTKRKNYSKCKRKHNAKFLRNDIKFFYTFTIFTLNFFYSKYLLQAKVNIIYGFACTAKV